MNMSIWVAMLLGFVQGLCEFLPVSSSGHLLLIQRMFGITEGAMFFSIMLHLATLVAVCVVYFDTLLKLIKKPISKTVGLLILAVLPTVLIALLFKKVAPFSTFYEAAERGEYLGYCFLLTAILLTISDFVKPRARKSSAEGEARKRNKGRKIKNMRVSDALIIGGMQGVGVLPGVSRSGSTISGALFAGLNRKAAADFSFLLSIPAILGGAVLEIPEALSAGEIGIHWTCIVAGMLVAGMTGYFAIRLMLAAIKKKKLWGFAIYTAVLGILILVDQFVTHRFF